MPQTNIGNLIKRKLVYVHVRL